MGAFGKYEILGKNHSKNQDCMRGKPCKMDQKDGFGEGHHFPFVRPDAGPLFLFFPALVSDFRANVRGPFLRSL